MIPVRVLIGRAVIQARQRVGLSQRALAKLTDCSQTTIYHIENGSHAVALENAYRIAHACGTTFADMFAELDSLEWKP
jgi:DNA-binding XRE family transcriptional regulator